MTGFLTATQAITSRLQANWVTTPILLDGDSAQGVTLDSGFVYCGVHIRESRFASINYPVPKIRTFGAISIDIYTAHNVGIGLGLTYSDTIAGIFRGKQFSGVLCYAPTIYTPQQVQHNLGEFWMTPLVCPFQYDMHSDIS